MPAPDYPRVPFPETNLYERWWFDKPLPFSVVEAVDNLHPHVKRRCVWADNLPVTKLAEAIERGLIHDGWPWELTEAGKAVLGSSRRR